MLNLCLHCGSRRVNRDQLQICPTPARTHSWVPVPHHRLLEEVEGTLTSSGLRVVNQAHALWPTGLRYFGLLEVVIPVTRVPCVLKEWREPRHLTFRTCGLTAWRLMNAFTESLKGNLQALPGRTQALHGLMDLTCGLP